MEDIRKSECVVTRTTLGWSRDRLAGASGVPMSAIYLLERLGSAGDRDDERILATLTRATAQPREAEPTNVTAVKASRPQMAQPQLVVSSRAAIERSKRLLKRVDLELAQRERERTERKNHP